MTSDWAHKAALRIVAWEPLNVTVDRVAEIIRKHAEHRAAQPESVWLVERTIDPGGVPHWLQWKNRDRRAWTPNAHEADRYEYKTDAAKDARAISMRGEHCFASEHVFCPSPAAQPEGVREALRHALNCQSAENGSDTPDFVLADFLTGCLHAWNAATKARETWYGREAGQGRAINAAEASLAEGKAVPEGKHEPLIHNCGHMTASDCGCSICRTSSCWCVAPEGKR